MPALSNKEIFKLTLPVKAPIPQKLRPAALRVVKRLLSLKKLEEICQSIPSDLSLKAYLAQAKRDLKTYYHVNYLNQAQIPKKGPVVVVANHPFGGIEGLIMAELMLGIRSDVRIMANYLLKSIPKLQDLFIFVDPFEKPSAIKRNLRPLREAIRWVQNGGLLVIFPAGEVSHLNLQTGKIVDPQWNSAVARIASHSKGIVIPAFFHGRNGALFHTMGLIHPRLRTAMLPRQLLKPCSNNVKLTIGRQILPNKIKSYANSKDLTEYLRWRTYLLPTNLEQQKQWSPPHKKNSMNSNRPKICISRNLVQKELESLAPNYTLSCANNLKVVQFYKHQAPNLMKEIGISREIAFRQVGEGTGQDMDLDKFDEDYLQLCLWDDKNKKIAGGYRVGFTDQIIAKHGISGLYTSTLFKYKSILFEHLNPAIELGRSFIMPQFQKSYSALLLLWKAIGRLLVQNPQYRHILGPVSISNNYNMLSKQLIVRFFEQNLKSEFAHLVRPKKPMRFNGMYKSAEYTNHKINNIYDLSNIISEIEGPKYGIPILLQQYVKLASKAAAWNLDPDFENVLDCLLISNLNQVDLKILSKYCGLKQAQTYLNYQNTEITPIDIAS